MEIAELVSVILPVRNGEHFIGQSIASVLKQTYRAIEVIVVDDGSSDYTRSIVEKFCKADSRVQLICSPPRGVSAARNLAISRSNGALIATIDADDLWREDKLERQLQVLRASGPKVGLVYCWSTGIDEDGKIILPTWNDSNVTGNVLGEIIASGIVGNGSTPLMRKSYVAAIGGYDTNFILCEDWKFYTSLASVCEFSVVPEYLVGYRLRHNSASMNVVPMEQAIEGVTEWIVQQWPLLPKNILIDRCYMVNAYLAFLAIRQRFFWRAIRYLIRAACARPTRVFDLLYIRLYFLLFAHRLGFCRYHWRFWRRPLYSLRKPT